MSLNFVVFWAVPIMGMGQLYKSVLKKFLQPAYLFLEGNEFLRKFAQNYVYRDPRHADFFTLSSLLVINCSITIPFLFYWQLTYGHLPAWLIFAYYCSWVGAGGSMMGAAYGLAHKEVMDNSTVCVLSAHLAFVSLSLGSFETNVQRQRPQRHR